MKEHFYLNPLSDKGEAHPAVVKINRRQCFQKKDWLQTGANLDSLLTILILLPTITDYI